MQTNGTCPEAHRGKHTDGAIYELCEYVYRYGTDTQRKKLSEAGYHVNLESVMRDQYQLSENELQEIVTLIGGRGKTPGRVESLLRYGGIPVWPSWIRERIMHEPGRGWTYCAGQDYLAEMATIRKIARAS